MARRAIFTIGIFGMPSGRSALAAATSNSVSARARRMSTMAWAAAGYSSTIASRIAAARRVAVSYGCSLTAWASRSIAAAWRSVRVVAIAAARSTWIWASVRASLIRHVLVDLGMFAPGIGKF